MENLFRNSAWLYDVDNRDNMHDDIPFYIEYAKQQQGEVLELGFGTGRVTLALTVDVLTLRSGGDLRPRLLSIWTPT